LWEPSRSIGSHQWVSWQCGMSSVAGAGGCHGVHGPPAPCCRRHTGAAVAGACPFHCGTFQVKCWQSSSETLADECVGSQPTAAFTVARKQCVSSKWDEAAGMVPSVGVACCWGLQQGMHPIRCPGPNKAGRAVVEEGRCCWQLCRMAVGCSSATGSAGGMSRQSELWEQDGCQVFRCWCFGGSVYPSIRTNSTPAGQHLL
jgi:hypothetical protein